MQSLLAIVLLLCILVGCGPDPYAAGREYAAEQIKRIQMGSEHSLVCPPLDLFEAAANDPTFAKNLRELSLSGSFDLYSNVSLGSFANLERVTFVDTKKTAYFLAALPPQITTLVLDRTDLTSGTGAEQQLDGRGFRESWIQSLTTLESLQTIFVNPWDGRLTSTAVEVLPKLKSLQTLDLEWASEEDIATLQNALPDCLVRLVAEH